MKGNKTYSVATLMIVATVAHYFGFIDTAIYNAALGVLGAGAIATFRHAISG